MPKYIYGLLKRKKSINKYNYSNIPEKWLWLKTAQYTKEIDKNLKFDLIMSGLIPPNPSELLSNGKLESLLDDLKHEYDYIIIDTAPTLLVTDTAIISNLADTVLYVTRANFTEKKLVKFISKIKQSQSIKTMGIILNNVGEKDGYGYGYKYKYKYSYNYGYEYGYGVNTKSNEKSSFLNKINKWFKIKKN
jgi:Mrp family chromosome partitioning ATPase